MLKKIIVFISLFIVFIISPAYAYHTAICYDKNDRPTMHYSCAMNIYWATPLWVKETDNPGPVSSDGTCASNTGRVFGSSNLIYDECINVDHGILIQYTN